MCLKAPSDMKPTQKFDEILNLALLESEHWLSSFEVGQVLGVSRFREENRKRKVVVLLIQVLGLKSIDHVVFRTEHLMFPPVNLLRNLRTLEFFKHFFSHVCLHRFRDFQVVHPRMQNILELAGWNSLDLLEFQLVVHLILRDFHGVSQFNFFLVYRLTIFCVRWRFLKR